MEALREHIDIDIYGSCYPDSLQCDRGNMADCWANITNQYKFYLSFENSVRLIFMSDNEYYITVVSGLHYREAVDPAGQREDPAGGAGRAGSLPASPLRHRGGAPLQRGPGRPGRPAQRRGHDQYYRVSHQWSYFHTECRW